MNKLIKTNILCLGLLSAVALTACSDSSETAINHGTTEERNAAWGNASDLKAWNVMDGSEIKLSASKSALKGQVKFAKKGTDGLSRAGIAYDVSNSDGSPVDLSQEGEGLCISYQSDFEVEVRLDEEDFASATVDKNLPYVSMKMEDGDSKTQCATWSEFKKKNAEKSDGEDAAKKVRSVQLVFVGKTEASGEFTIRRMTPYVRSELWFGKKGASHVKTGFEKGEEGVELTVFEDSSEAYIAWSYDDGFKTMDEIIDANEGLDGEIVFKKSSSNPDIGFQFLVAGKTTKDGKEKVYSANVLDVWKGMCLTYQSEMDIAMEFIPSDSVAKKIEGGSFKVIFDKQEEDWETSCFEFEDVLNKDTETILKNLTIIRLKLQSEGESQNNFYIRRISSLLPENLSIEEYGEKKNVKASSTSEFKSGTSFLWDGSKDGDKVNTGIKNAKDGGIWFNSSEESENYTFGFPDDVKADDDGYVISSLVNKYHSFQGYVKSDEVLEDLARISFNTVSSKQETADISAWGGFCIHYISANGIRIAIFTNESTENYWYAEVEYTDDLIWGKVSWDAFQNIDEEYKGSIEDVLGKISMVQLQFPYDGVFNVDKFGSYDQCGK